MSRFLSPRFSALEAYVPGEQPRDVPYIKLNTNESPYPPSPKVLDRVNRAEVERLRLYSDPDGLALRAKIAASFGVGVENVVLGNGSDEILSLAFMGFCDGERGAAFPDISYGFYSVYADLYNLEAKIVPLDDAFRVRPEDYYSLNRFIAIANPNAPTGLALAPAEIEGILRSNPDSVVLIDEAYVDFGGESCLPLVKKYDNLLVVRTYSKSRSLAGARLGFGIASAPLIEDLNRLRCSTNPYNINRLTLIAGEAALDDPDYFEACRREIIQTRSAASARLEALGFEATDSKANFIFARHPDCDGGKLQRELKARGVLVRHFDKPRIRDYLRITVGTPEQMEALAKALEKILKEGSAMRSSQ